MNPRNDYVFHRLFGYKGNEEITSGLIGAIINQEIETIKIDETPITEQNIKDDKVGVLDIKARLNNNILCDVEMQVAKKDNMDRRIMFYWSKLYSSEISSGEDYNILHKTIAILIADFELDILNTIPKFHTKWQIREEDFRKIILTDTLEIHIIELPKLIKQLEENKGIKKDKVTLWSMFILNPENLGDEIMSENEDIKKAKEELERIKLNEQDQRLAELRMKYILDQNAIRNSGFREGKEAGLQEGKEIGLQEGKEIGLQEGKEIGLQDGKKAEKFEIAKKLIALKMPISQIIQITNLTEEEIKQIQ